ncbi:hypothetical protein GGH95_003439, partial [Coemansia sp. RSA 1836]
RRNRHIWTPDGDAKLVSLVSKHGLKWTRIGEEMGLDLSAMSYRRRWEVLHATNQGAWTLAEDRKLVRSVEILVQRQPFGSYGWWVQIAKLMNTKRSPRDCYWRWNHTAHKLSGVNINKWSEDEQRRFDDALLTLMDTSDSDAAVDRARQEEPWLMPAVEPRFTQPAGFWILLSQMMGTRTAQQCRSQWVLLDRLSKFGGRPSKMILSIAETKQLARIVEQHGKKWGYIQDQHFPQIPSNYLSSIYDQWTGTADKYKIDLYTVNPEEMLIDYKPGACTALRRTGADGLYDPDGTLRIVRVFHSRSPLVPFRLALMSSIDRGQYREGLRSGETPINSRSFIPKGRSVSHEADLRRCGTDTLNRLITSLAVFGEDWVAVGKNMGLRASKCQSLYQDAVKIMPSIKATALAGETRVNRETASVRP